MSDKYFGFWDSYTDMRAAWQEDGDDFPSEDEILVALYDGGSYDGLAFVLFHRDGKLYEVHGSHCSCYGLEGQWSPEETSWAALGIRTFEDEIAGVMAALIRHGDT